MRTTMQERAELRAIAEAALEAPWHSREFQRFIAAAQEHMLPLLKDVDELEKRLGDFIDRQRPGSAA